MGSVSSSTTPFEDLKAKLSSSYTLSHWQRFSKVIHYPGLGDRCLTARMDAMVALLSEDEVPGSLFLSLFLERLPIKMRDHLVANKFKALHADKLLDARRPQPTDPLLTTAETTSSSPSCGRVVTIGAHHLPVVTNSRSCKPGRMLLPQTFWIFS